MSHIPGPGDAFPISGGSVIPQAAALANVMDGHALRQHSPFRPPWRGDRG